MFLRTLAAVGVTFCAATMVYAASTELTAQEKQDGWQLLFDGKTTRGWRGFGKDTFPEKGWRVADGELRLEPGSKAGDIISVERFSEFDLQWEWKIPARANNGLKYFILEERGEAVGHEYQMIDDSLVKSPLQKTATFYDVLPRQTDVSPKIDEWNQSRVRVKRNKVEHWLNGTKVLEYELGSEAVKAAVAKSKFRRWMGFGERQNGHILLTYHSDAVSYRNIKIRNLQGNPP